MKKHQKTQTISPETQEEAMKIARGIQKPGQSKEQTKLIAQGIQKGIQIYKKQQKEKSRERDKLHKKNFKPQEQMQDDAPQQVIQYRQHWLPWSLLVLTWAGILFFWLFVTNQ